MLHTASKGKLFFSITSIAMWFATGSASAEQLRVAPQTTANQILNGAENTATATPANHRGGWGGGWGRRHNRGWRGNYHGGGWGRGYGYYGGYYPRYGYGYGYPAYGYSYYASPYYGTTYYPSYGSYYY